VGTADDASPGAGRLKFKIRAIGRRASLPA
jgi:hypothetical protein